MKVAVSKTNWVILCMAISIGACKQPDRNYPMVNTPVADQGFYQAGIEEVDKKVRSSPENPDAYFKKALYLQAAGQIDEALSTVKQAINLDPVPDYLFTEADLLFQKQQYELALARISRAQILGGDYPDLWHLMAKLNYLQGNFEGALDEINVAVSKYPKDLNYYCTKGKIQWALNDTTAALESFKKSVGSPESEYESLKHLAVISREIEAYDSARIYLSANLKNNPNDRDLLLEKATLHTVLFQPDSALAIYHILRDQDSSDWVPLFESALVHFQRRRYDSTLYYTDQTLQFNSDHLPSILTQARVFDRRTYYGTSIKKYQEILEIDSTYTPAVEELAKLRGKIAYLQKIQKDREANSQVETISPTRPPIKQ